MATEHLHLPGETAGLDHTERDIRFVHRMHVAEAAILAMALTIVALALVAIFAI